MFALNKVSLSFSGTPLFKDISFLVNPGERIGLTGKNGAGKSTLLKLMSGKLQPESGQISKPADFRLGYLSQDLHLRKDNTVRQEAASAFVELQALQQKIDYINEQLVVRTDYETDSYLKLIEDLNEFSERFQMLGGYTYEADIERVLGGLGFKLEDLDQSLSTFSGGWQMRVELAKILLQKNNLLLLDEPTNHLDIESIMWLENFLVSENAAVILVSHDRAFLDAVTSRTIEVANGKAYDFPAPYSRYVVLRNEMREQQLQTRKNQEKEIKETEKLIDRFRAKASKASFAQSLIKRLDKMELIEVDEMESAQMRFRFPPSPRSGKVVVEATNIYKSFGDNHVLRGIDFLISRGDRVAFVGQNGQGKSTFLKILINQLEAQGAVVMGHQVHLGYYAQNQADDMNGEKSVLDTLLDIANEETRPRVRNLLGSFLFSGEDVEKKVKVLSGGEKGRLALCKLLLQPINLLVMDEPTNHLDMQSKEVLKEALMQYDGTLVLVSHDRDFLQGLTDKVYNFKAGRIKEHLGDIKSFLASLKLETFREFEAQKAAKAATAQVTIKQPVEEKVNFQQQKEQERLQRKLERDVSKKETEYTALESKLAELDEKLLDPAFFKTVENNPDFFVAYESDKKKLEQVLEQWDALSQELEQVRE